jgi:hypothetical protein
METPNHRKRTLVVYDGEANGTAMAARRLAQRLDADAERIVEARRGSGIIDRLRACWRRVLGHPVEIAPSCFDPKAYSLVVVATPVERGTIAPSVRAYVDAHAHDFADVAFLCTHPGTGSARAAGDFESACGRRAALVLVLRADEVASGTFERKIRAFVARLRPSLAPSPRLTIPPSSSRRPSRRPSPPPPSPACTVRARVA